MNLDLSLQVFNIIGDRRQDRTADLQFRKLYRHSYVRFASPAPSTFYLAAADLLVSLKLSQFVRRFPNYLGKSWGKHLRRCAHVGTAFCRAQLSTESNHHTSAITKSIAQQGLDHGQAVY